VARYLALPAALLGWSVLGFLAIDFFGLRHPQPEAAVAAHVLAFVSNAGAVLLVVAVAVLWVPMFKPPWLMEVGLLGLAVGLFLIVGAEAALLAAVQPIAGAIFILPLLAYGIYWVPVSHREVVVALEAVFAAPPEAVFQLVVDPESEVRLLPDVKRLEVIGGGKLGKGTRLRGRARSGVAFVTAEDEIVEFDPPRRVAYSTRSGAPSNRATFDFEPVGTGARLKYRYRAVLSYPNALIGGYARGRAADRIVSLRTRWLEALRSELAG
jgi:uncharacterized protein YndB with AHSA1/START domain